VGAEDVGDLLHGVFTGVVEPLGECDLVGVEPRPSATVASSRAGRGKAVTRVGHDQLALELGQDRQHPESRGDLGGAIGASLLAPARPDG